MAEINAVPYVDVMLVLLVVFMISAPLLTEGFEINLAKVEASAVSLPDPIIVSVLEDQSYRINIGESLDQVASEQTIASRLQKITARNQNPAILVKGDAQVPYRAILRLLSILQGAGIQNVGLVTQAPVGEEDN
jgi:biopolymer transport protein TolR